jgi:hypothetical protein
MINCLFNLANELYVSTVVNLAGTFILTVAFYMNKDGHLEQSKRLGIITINLYLFTVSLCGRSPVWPIPSVFPIIAGAYFCY